ncbi:MAG: hypothetical protein GY898_13450 [Proteobacteria bacterium]|nr:hypothetical protein [Pseudomonadota bacterium]
MDYTEIGNCWLADTVGRKPISEIHLRLDPGNLRTQPARIASTAGWAAGFAASDLEPEDGRRPALLAVVHALVSNVAVHATDRRFKAELRVTNLGSRIRIETTNICDLAQAEALAKWMKRLGSEQADDLLRGEERSAAQSPEHHPRKGLAALRREHCRHLGAAIDRGPREGLHEVVVRVELPRN